MTLLKLEDLLVDIFESISICNQEGVRVLEVGTGTIDSSSQDHLFYSSYYGDVGINCLPMRPYFPSV